MAPGGEWGVPFPAAPQAAAAFTMHHRPLPGPQDQFPEVAPCPCHFLTFSAPPGRPWSHPCGSPSAPLPSSCPLLPSPLLVLLLPPPLPTGGSTRERRWTLRGSYLGRRPAPQEAHWRTSPSPAPGAQVHGGSQRPRGPGNPGVDGPVGLGRGPGARRPSPHGGWQYWGGLVASVASCRPLRGHPQQKKSAAGAFRCGPLGL